MSYSRELHHFPETNGNFNPRHFCESDSQSSKDTGATVLSRLFLTEMTVFPFPDSRMFFFGKRAVEKVGNVKTPLVKIITGHLIFH